MSDDDPLREGLQPLVWGYPRQRSRERVLIAFSGALGVLGAPNAPENRHETHSRAQYACSVAQIRSMMVAVPMPPPVHMVTRPVCRSRRSISSSKVPMSMAPVAPMG